MNNPNQHIPPNLIEQSEFIIVARDSDSHVLICNGCGSVRDLDEMRTNRHATISCCPEREMVRAIPATALESAQREIETLRDVLERARTHFAGEPFDPSARECLAAIDSALNKQESLG